MKDRFRIKNTKNLSLIISFLAFCLFFTFVIFAVGAELSKIAADQRTAAFNAITTKRALILNALNERLHIVRGLEAFALAYPDFSEKEFSVYAEKLMSTHSGIRALQLAPNAVVRYCYPQKGNEVVNQLNLLKDPTRKEAALKSILTKKFTIAGPYNLKQGGFGLVGRSPVFMDGHFWGFATVVMNFDPILKESGISDPNGEYEYALRGVDGLGYNGDVFWGNKDIFNKNNLSLAISIPNGQWIISAKLKDPGILNGSVVLLFILGTIVSLSVGYASYRISENFFNIKSALDENTEKYRVLFNTFPLGITIFDENGKVIERNKEAERLIGVPKDKKISNHIIEEGWKVIRPDGSLMPMEELPSSIALKSRQKVENVELGLLRDNGSITWVSSTAAPFQAKGLGAATIYTDITRKIESEKELLVAKEMALESSKLKSVLLTNLNHEFRTPLTGILGLSALLRDELKDSEQIQMAQGIIKSGNRLLSTLTSILDLSELESGKRNFNLEDVFINKEIQSVVEAFKSQADQKGLTLTFSDEKNFIVSGSRDFIRQTLINLIDNAIKYTPKGRVDITLSSISEDDRKWIRCNISDTGIGISNAEQDLIFKEFRQASEGLNRSFEGSGLGLSVARKMVEAMNGRISVESEPHNGSVFSVYLPLVNETEKKLKASAIVTQPSDNSDTIKHPVVKQNTAGLPHILLVEDNFINKEVICTYLRNICKVDHARDGITSIKMTQENNYCMILMDINLGAGINGIEAAQKIREIRGYENTPIIAVTGYSMKSEKDELLKSGLTHYLAKPFEKPDLIKIVKEILNQQS